MKMDNLREVIQNLEERGGVVNALPCQEPLLIKQLEHDLRLHFPESIRLFYRDYEYLQVGVYEFIWIKNLKDTTLNLRQAGIPVNHLPVIDDGMGRYYYVVCSEQGTSQPSDFGAVLHHIQQFPNIFEFCSSDFIDFVISRVARELEELIIAQESEAEEQK